MIFLASNLFFFLPFVELSIALVLSGRRLLIRLLSQPKIATAWRNTISVDCECFSSSDRLEVCEQIVGD